MLYWIFRRRTYEDSTLLGQKSLYDSALLKKMDLIQTFPRVSDIGLTNWSCLLELKSTIYESFKITT